MSVPIHSNHLIARAMQKHVITGGYFSRERTEIHEGEFGSAPETQVAWTSHYENILGTSMDMTLSSPSRAHAWIEEAVLASLVNDTQSLSTWLPDSEVSRWLNTRDQPIPISRTLMDVLSLYDLWLARTNGALNPAAADAARLWFVSDERGRFPTRAELDASIASMNQQHWELSAREQTATHLTSTPLTFASFTKSYIANRAVEVGLAAGASGIMLNIGGDVLVRGNLCQAVTISDPLAHAENDAPIDRILLRNRALATSGSYRRMVVAGVSHILDPRCGLPASGILSSSVVATDPVIAGALATAFSILTLEESGKLARSLPDVEYLLLTRSGERISSEGWSANRAPTLKKTFFTSAPAQSSTSARTAAAQHFELSITLELAPATRFLYRRPVVAVWVEDENHFPVRTLALWSNRDRYLPHLRSWYHDDQLRLQSEATLIADTISSATRPPGRYSLMWDGTDNHGRTVKAGEYTVCVEAVREHGGYSIVRQRIDLNQQPQKHTVEADRELGAITFEYRKQ